MTTEFSETENLPEPPPWYLQGYKPIWFISFATAFISSPILVAMKDRWPWVILIPLVIGTFLIFIRELNAQRRYSAHEEMHYTEAKQSESNVAQKEIYLPKFKNSTPPSPLAYRQPEPAISTSKRILSVSPAAGNWAKRLNPINAIKSKDTTEYRKASGTASETSRIIDEDFSKTAQESAVTLVKHLVERKKLQISSEREQVEKVKLISSFIESTFKENHRIPVRHKEKVIESKLPQLGIERGCFDKTEPTLYKDQDLDIPTYIRKSPNIN